MGLVRSSDDTFIDELVLRVGDRAFTANAGVDVALVAVQALKLSIEAADLPSGVIGAALTWSDERAALAVSQRLATAVADPRGSREHRDALAHLMGHVLCARRAGHSSASASTDSPPGHAMPRVAVCAGSSVGAYFGVPRSEIAANEWMARLLLPRCLLLPRLGPVLRQSRVSTFDAAVRAGVGGEVLAQLALQFGVSRELVFHRLKQLKGRHGTSGDNRPEQA